MYHIRTCIGTSFKYKIVIFPILVRHFQSNLDSIFLQKYRNSLNIIQVLFMFAHFPMTKVNCLTFLLLLLFSSFSNYSLVIHYSCTIFCGIPFRKMSDDDEIRASRLKSLLYRNVFPNIV